MALLKQIWTLMSKNFRHQLMRHLLTAVIMAFLVPIILSTFFSFAKNLFVPPAKFGIGQSHPVKTLAQAFESAQGGGREKVVLVNGGYTGGDIETVLDDVAAAIGNASDYINVVRIDSEQDLVTECRSTLRGVTACFNAIIMRSSPDEGNGGIWNYTIRTDSEFAGAPYKINIEKSDNPEEVYLLPMQRAVDTAIARLEHPDLGPDPLADVHEKPFTSTTPEEREARIRKIYHEAIINFMGVVFIATTIWISYHLTGFVATERETGMSQLIDAMMPVRKPWMALAARVIAHHLSFSLIYAPAWVIASLVVRYGVFANTNIGILIIFHLLGGLSIASMSIMIASFFKKAQLSGITATLSILLLGILAQAITKPGTGVVAILSVLFAPCTYVYFIIHMAYFEKLNHAASLTENAPEAKFQLPGIFYWVMLIIQIFVYPLIGAIIERHFYGTSTKGRTLTTNARHGEVLQDNAVELQGFTKIYKPSFLSRVFSLGSKPSEPVVAVSDLSFSAGRGQIVCLLGANGSGKSTTLDAIAGLNKLTSGAITIDGTGGLGIAPQKNVLWDDLNVEEHLRIFNRLKSPGSIATKEEIDDLIRAIDLWPKRKSLSKTLSGGQKRKLQLGMMLTGGSAVCCVDEVSSGLDPLSRRKIWDILLAERGKRTLILTTHFLDEADLLADHIAILSKGTLRAEGSSVALKDNIGGGYRVHVHKTPDVTHMPDFHQVKKDDAFDMTSYSAPTSTLAAGVIKELESMGITDYRFSGPTIEDVFLQLAEEIRDEEGFNSSEKTATLPEKSSNNDLTGSVKPSLQLMDGQRVGYMRQAAILFSKRLTILKRSWVIYAVAFLIPILAAGLTTLFVKGKTLTGCTPSERASNYSTEDAFSQISEDDRITFLAGPSSGIQQGNILRLLQPIFQGSNSGAAVGGSVLSNLKIVETYDEFTQFIEENRKNVTTGLWLGDDTTPPTFAWVANLFITSSILSQQLLNVINTNTTISTTWSPFDTPFNPGIGDALNLVIYMGIALAVYPAFFALYPSNERRRFVRALEYSNGVRPFPLWMAYLVFDFIIVLVSAGIVTAMWASLSNVWYHIEYVFIVFFLYGLCSILFSYVISLFTKSQLGTFAWAAVIQAVFMLGYLIAYVCILTYVQVSKIDSTLRATHFIIALVSPIASAMRAMFLSTNLFSTSCDGNELSANPGGLLEYGGPILYLIVQSIILFILLIWIDSGSPFSSLRGLFSRSKPPTTDDSADEEVANELERVTSSGTEDNGLRVMHLTKSFGSNTAVDNVTFGIKRGEVFALLGPNGAGKSTTISLIRGDIKPSHNGGDVFVQDVSVTKNLALARTNLGVCPQIDAMDQMTVREHLEFYARVRGIPDIQHNVSAVLTAVGLEAFESRMAHALSGGNKRKLSLGIALMGNPTVVLLDEPSSGLDAASKRIMWKTLAATVPGRSILLTTHSMEEADALAGRAGILARRMLALGTPDNLRHRFGDALHIHLVSATAPRTSDQEMERVLAWIRQRLPSASVEAKTYHGQMRFSVRASDVLALPMPSTTNTTTSGSPSSNSSGSSSPSNKNFSRKMQQPPQPQQHAEEILPTSGTTSARESAIGRLVVLLEEHKRDLGISHYSVSPTGLDQVFLTIVGQHNVREENYEEKKVGFWRKVWRFGRA